MRKVTACLGLGAAAVAFTAGTIGAQTVGRTTWDGVYSDAQDARGEAAYQAHCSTCHGATMTGTGEAPGLTGGEWLGNWNGLTVGDLLERVRKTMPFNAPGSLSRDVYADIVAHILKANGFPAGKADLANRSEMLADIKIVAQRPAGAVAQAAAAAPAAGAATPAPEAGRQQIAAPAPLYPDPTGPNAPNSQPNPYKTQVDFFRVPAGMETGSTSGVAVDSKGNIWIAGRCGANTCTGSAQAPIMQFTAQGAFVKAFGAGVFNFPHGLFIDAGDNIWVVDERVEGGKGGTVTKFSPDGKVLMTLGKPGVAGGSPETFAEPNAVLVAPNGSIFVSEGHTPGKVSRVVKFDASGKFVKQWGTTGREPGQFDVPHALAMDKAGRLYVGDRWNNRIQYFDQDGKLLGQYLQWGRPSGMFIDGNDILYVADSESRSPQGYGYHPGWKRGIRVGRLSDGIVTAFIPDRDPTPETGATSGAEGIWVDRSGVIYGAQVKERSVFRYVK